MTTPEKIRVSGPSVLAAMVPSLLGFTPADGSLVVITLVDRRVGMTARVDDPGVDKVEGLAAELAPALRRGEPELTGLVVIGWQAATGVASDLMWALRRLGLPTIEALVVQDGRVADDCCQGPWQPLGTDVLRPVTVVQGQVNADSREDLEDRITWCGSVKPPHGGDQLIVDGWRATVHTVDDRDHALAMFGHASVEKLAQDVEGLSLTLRFTPTWGPKRDDLLALLAVAAWLRGNGALASIALDQASTGHSLSMLLRQALAVTLPPAELRKLLASMPA